MGAKHIYKFTTAILAATSFIAVPVLAQAQSKLIIEDFVGTINWSQSSNDIEVDIVRGAGELDVQDDNGRDVKLLGGYEKLRRIQCKGTESKRKISVTRKKAYKPLNAYPELNIAIPANTEVVLQNSVPFIYGQPNVKAFTVSPKGCGEIEVGNVAELLDAKISGSSDFTAKDIGQAKIKLSGSSDMQIGNVGELNIGLSGASGFEGGNTKSLQAKLSGSSDMRAGDVTGTAEVQLSGATNMKIGNITDGLDYEGGGSSDAVVNRISGPVFIEVSGASDIDIKDGQADEMKVAASGASDVTFGGLASNLDAKASGAADISIDEVSGTLKQSRSGAADINIKVYNAVVSQE